LVGTSLLVAGTSNLIGAVLSGPLTAASLNVLGTSNFTGTTTMASLNVTGTSYFTGPMSASTIIASAISAATSTLGAATASALQVTGLAPSSVVTTDASENLVTVSSASTYTPVIQDSAGNAFNTPIQNGRYYKVGHQYFVSIQVAWTGHPAAVGTNTVQVTLPVPIGASDLRVAATIGYALGIGFTGTYLTSRANTGDSVLVFDGWTNSGVPTDVLVSQVAGAGELQLNVSYWDN